LWQDGRLWAGSRTEWKRAESGSLWWRAVAVESSIEAFCREHQGVTLYGEVYGQVQKLRYGAGPGEVRFAAFDLLDGDRWLSHAEARDLGRDLPWVPIVAERESFDPERLREMAEGPSLVAGAGHLREGIVAKPNVERTHPEIGRVMLKVVSNAYLEKP
jgi:RNA ligase (TIGR02306 family)